MIALLIWTWCRITGQDGFDPAHTKFAPEELQPQPIIKKSKKVSDLNMQW